HSRFVDQASNPRGGDYLAADRGLIYSDNVTRVQNGSGDTLALLGLVGDASREGPRLDYRLASDLALVKYLSSHYQTQPFGYLDGTGAIWLVPGSFSWTGRETYTQAVIDPFAPVTPDNLEGLNYVTTGPRFTLRPTLRTTVTLNGTYSYLASVPSAPAELPQSQVPGGSVWRVELSRQISPSSRLSLHAVKQVTDAANLFRLNLDQPVPAAAANRLTTADPFTDRELGASWR